MSTSLNQSTSTGNVVEDLKLMETMLPSTPTTPTSKNAQCNSFLCCGQNNIPNEIKSEIDKKLINLQPVPKPTVPTTPTQKPVVLQNPKPAVNSTQNNNNNKQVQPVKSNVNKTTTKGNTKTVAKATNPIKTSATSTGTTASSSTNSTNSKTNGFTTVGYRLVGNDPNCPNQPQSGGYRLVPSEPQSRNAATNSKPSDTVRLVPTDLYSKTKSEFILRADQMKEITNDKNAVIIPMKKKEIRQKMEALKANAPLGNGKIVIVKVKKNNNMNCDNNNVKLNGDHHGNFNDDDEDEDDDDDDLDDEDDDESTDEYYEYCNFKQKNPEDLYKNDNQLNQISKISLDGIPLNLKTSKNLSLSSSGSSSGPSNNLRRMNSNDFTNKNRTTTLNDNRNNNNNKKNLINNFDMSRTNDQGFTLPSDNNTNNVNSSNKKNESNDLYSSEIDYMNSYLKSLPDYKQISEIIHNSHKFQQENDKFKLKNPIVKSNSYHFMNNTNNKNYNMKNQIYDIAEDTNPPIQKPNKIARSISGTTITHVNDMNQDFQNTKIDHPNIKPFIPINENENKLNNRSSAKQFMNDFWRENTSNKSNSSKIGWDYHKIITKSKETIKNIFNSGDNNNSNQSKPLCKSISASAVPSTLNINSMNITPISKITLNKTKPNIELRNVHNQPQQSNKMNYDFQDYNLKSKEKDPLAQPITKSYSNQSILMSQNKRSNDFINQYEIPYKNQIMKSASNQSIILNRTPQPYYNNPMCYDYNFNCNPITKSASNQSILLNHTKRLPDYSTQLYNHEFQNQLSKSSSNQSILLGKQKIPSEIPVKNICKSSSSSTIYNKPYDGLFRRKNSDTFIPSNNNDYGKWNSDISLANQMIMKNNDLLKNIAHNSNTRQPIAQSTTSAQNFFVKQTLPQPNKIVFGYPPFTKTNQIPIPTNGQLPSAFGNICNKTKSTYKSYDEHLYEPIEKKTKENYLFHSGYKNDFNFKPPSQVNHQINLHPISNNLFSNQIKSYNKIPGYNNNNINNNNTNNHNNNNNNKPLNLSTHNYNNNIHNQNKQENFDSYLIPTTIESLLQYQSQPYQQNQPEQKKQHFYDENIGKFIDDQLLHLGLNDKNNDQLSNEVEKIKK